MAKFELTISTDYVSDWGLREGVREILQNALDGQQDGYPMTIAHDPKTNTLSVTNQGVRLERSMWLLGFSSKGDGNHRGHFGEGSALGTLALVRAGHRVTFVNDDETWTPVLAQSDAFPGQQVLTISTRTRAATGAFTVRVEGITPEQWALCKSNFLDLDENYAKGTIEYNVERLDHPSFIEKLYVKGILVDTWEGLRYGYNFTNIATDRDRRMVSQWQAEGALGCHWSFAATSDAMRPVLVELLKSNARDVKGVATYLGFTEREALRADFLTTHGEKAWPTDSAAEHNDLEHWGLTPVIVSESYLKALREAGMTIESAREAHRTAVLTSVPVSELRSIERSILEEAMEMVVASAARKGLPNPRPCTRVVEFSDPATYGMHVRENGEVKILLARHILTSFERTIQVLVHETAHFVASDGDVAHERTEGELFADIVGRLVHSAVR
jgi:hypothetical protein